MMNKQDQEQWLEKLNEIIYSSAKLPKDKLILLVSLREQVKKSKPKSDLLETIGKFKDWFS